jgi:glycosyltransferase involved in cell wall biosynthesis
MVTSTAHQNILYAITSLDMGGEERHLLELARYMRDCGHSVRVCCLRVRGVIGRRLEEEGFPVVYFNEPESPSAGVLLKNAWQIAGLIREHSIDLVHSFLVRANIEARLAGRLAPARCAIVNSEGCINVRKSRTAIWLDRSTFRWCDVVLANSRAVADVLSRRERVPKEKIKVVYQGIDVARFRYAGRSTHAAMSTPRDIVIGYVGRLHSEKGPRYLIEAASLILKTTRRFRLVVVGDGPEAAHLRRMVEAHGLSDRVEFTGMQADIVGYMRSFDILAIPSLEEGLPTVAMEALACGVPIVATAVGGTPEVVQHGQTGLLVPAAAATSLADALVNLITNESLRRRFAHNGPNAVELKFQAARMLAQTAEAYAHVLKVIHPASAAA